MSETASSKCNRSRAAMCISSVGFKLSTRMLIGHQAGRGERMGDNARRNLSRRLATLSAAPS
jgi:hypothetical protein